MDTSKQEQPKSKIRPGQKTPFRKSTNKEMIERVEWVAIHILSHKDATETQLRAAIKDRFKVHWLTAKEYIIRAKDLIASRVKINRNDALAIAMCGLLDNIKNGTRAERNNSIRLLIEVHGLEAPKRNILEGVEGAAPIKIETTDKTPLPMLTPQRISELIALRENSIKANGHNGNGNHN